VRRLSEADLILCNGPAAGFAGPVFELVPGRARALSGDRERDLADFVGLRVWAVAGIGNPDSFYTLLARHGIDIEPVMVADHGSVDLERLVAEHNRPILMTEKDVVKYPETTITDAWYVPVDVRMTSESESVVDRLLNKLETS
jgi:tetraacyldisaccharide 4'-kinase